MSVHSGSEECFFLTATIGSSCFGSFEILSKDPESLTISVHGPVPNRRLIHESKYSGPGSIDKIETEGSFAFDVEYEGDHSMCMKNDISGREDKLVAFNFLCVENSGDVDYEFASMQRELLDLQKGLVFLKDHQSFLNQRENRHKSTLESTNLKVLAWTVLETVILISMALWQIGYISKFFETKRKL